MYRQLRDHFAYPVPNAARLRSSMTGAHLAEYLSDIPQRPTLEHQQIVGAVQWVGERLGRPWLLPPDRHLAPTRVAVCKRDRITLHVGTDTLAIDGHREGILQE